MGVSVFAFDIHLDTQRFMYFVKLSRKPFIFLYFSPLYLCFLRTLIFRPCLHLFVMVTGGTRSSLFSGKVKCLAILDLHQRC